MMSVKGAGSVLLLVALLLVAGCTGGPGGASGNDTPGRWVVHWFNGDGAEVWIDGEYRGTIEGTTCIVEMSEADPAPAYYSIRNEEIALYTGCITAVPDPGETVDLFPSFIVTEPPDPGAGTGTTGWYVVHDPTEGAEVHVDGRYAGSITDGAVAIPVDTSRPPHERFTVIDPDGTEYTVSLSAHPSPGERVHYYPRVQLAPHGSPTASR